LPDCRARDTDGALRLSRRVDVDLAM